MPVTLDGITYLNAHESAKYLGVSYMTFKDFRRDYHLQHYLRPGTGRSLWYRQEDLKNLRNFIPGKTPEIKEMRVGDD